MYKEVLCNIKIIGVYTYVMGQNVSRFVICKYVIQKSKIMMFVRKKLLCLCIHYQQLMSFDKVEAKLTQCHNQCILVEVLDFANMVSGGNALYQNSTFINTKSKRDYVIYIIINVSLWVISAPRGWIWACDSSLEPSCYKNDHVMGNFRFACTARPQCAKMYFYYIRQL